MYSKLWSVILCRTGVIMDMLRQTMFTTDRGVA